MGCSCQRSSVYFRACRRPLYFAWINTAEWRAVFQRAAADMAFDKIAGVVVRSHIIYSVCRWSTKSCRQTASALAWRWFEKRQTLPPQKVIQTCRPISNVKLNQSLTNEFYNQQATDVLLGVWQSAAKSAVCIWEASYRTEQLYWRFSLMSTSIGQLGRTFIGSQCLTFKIMTHVPHTRCPTLSDHAFPVVAANSLKNLPTSFRTIKSTVTTVSKFHLLRPNFTFYGITWLLKLLYWPVNIYVKCLWNGQCNSITLIIAFKFESY